MKKCDSYIYTWINDCKIYDTNKSQTDKADYLLEGWKAGNGILSYVKFITQ